MFQVEFQYFELEKIEKQKEGLLNIKSFMGLPLKKEFDKEDYAIVGVPFDTATTNRAGCRFGPRAIREWSDRFRPNVQDARWIIKNLKGMDYGNVPVMPGYTEESLMCIYQSLKEVLDADLTPIVLGGDHLITYAELRAYSEKYGRVAMIHFDSHNDTSDRKEIQYNHGTPFRRAIEDGFLDTSHSIQVGIRGYAETYRMDYAKENGMRVITGRELHDMGIARAAEMIREQVGNQKCMVTFDIDFLDPSAAPGTGTPVSGGFTTYEAMELLRQGVTGLNVAGFDLVEVMEDYDPGRITALAAYHIVYQYLTILSKKKAEMEKD